MGGHRGSLSWYMAFSHHKVEMDFALYSESSKERSFVDRLKSFMEKTPINRQKPAEYSVRDAGYGWEIVYRKEILSNEELVEMSATRSQGRSDPKIGRFHGFGRFGVHTH